MKQALLVILGLLIIGGGWLAYSALSDDNPDQIQNETTDQPTDATEPDFTFGQPTKSAHYVSNTPEHGITLNEVPSEVVINFDFDLAGNSTISVTKDGEEHGVGTVNFASDKRSMSRAVATDAGSGLYTVSYQACWPDGSCHDGQFQFGVQQ